MTYDFGKWEEDALNSPVYPDERFPPSPYYRFLKVLAEQVRPKVSVELGVCGGGGSFHMCQGNKEGKVIGVDIANPYPDNIEFIQNHCKNFKFWEGDSKLAAPEIHDLFGPIKILFIDTDHTHGTTMDEWNAWKNYLEHDHIVVMDDLTRPGMAEAWEEIPGNKVRMDRLHSESGFGLIWNRD